MATRPITSGRTPTRRALGGVQRVYEDFKPMSEWQQDEESNVLLLLHLPGFQKQQLKVSTEGRNILRVHGERLVAGNKWNRFQEVYQVPDDCDMGAIRARFEEGILTITMPRKQESDKAIHEISIPSQRTQDDLSSKARPSPDILNQSSPPKAHVEPIPQSVSDDSVLPNVTASTVAADKGQDKKSLESPPDQKTFSEPQHKKIREEEQNSTEEKPEKHRERNDDHKIFPEVKELADHVENVIVATDVTKLLKDKVGSSDHVEKPTQMDAKANEKEDTTTTALSGGLGNYVPKVQDFSKLNEQRQLLVNVGVAVLVIVALGAYVYSKFGSGEAT